MNVLTIPFGPYGFTIHLPPFGFVPPPPNTMGYVKDAMTACGMPLGDDALVGYGAASIVRRAERETGLTIVWCPRCFPLGP